MLKKLVITICEIYFWTHVEIHTFWGWGQLNENTNSIGSTGSTGWYVNENQFQGFEFKITQIY